MSKMKALLAAFILMPTLSGCVAVAAGAGAAGGYYVAKDERKASQIADDASTTASIKAKYADDEMVDALQINIDTYYNVVTLRGTVPSQAVAQRAVDIARSTKGVRAVRSELTVSNR